MEVTVVRIYVKKGFIKNKQKSKIMCHNKLVGERRRPGVGNLFIITGCMKCALPLTDLKINWFFLKYYLYLTMKKSDFSWLTV